MTGRLCTIDLTQPCSVIHRHNSNAQSKWDFMGTKCQKWICHLSEDSYLRWITIHTHTHTHLSTTSRPLQHVCCSTSISLSQSISGSSEKNHWYRWMEPSNSLRERAKQNFNGFLNNVSMSANTRNHLSGLQKKVPKKKGKCPVVPCTGCYKVTCEWR